jgi:hypothetical protein
MIMETEDKLVVAAWIWTVPYVIIASFNPFWAAVWFLPVLILFVWIFLELVKDVGPYPLAF